MKFATYNIQFGRGVDGRIDLDRIARAVEDADVVALQEVERFFDRSDNVDQVEALAKRFKRYHWVFGAGVDIHADREDHSEGIEHRRQQFGNMLLARTPILTSRNHLLPKVGSTGPLSIQRSALEGVILCGGRKVRIYSTHLTHISAAERLNQVEEILRIDRDAVREAGPISGDLPKAPFDYQENVSTLPRESIVMGDFNFTYDSAEYSRMIGEKSDYGGRVTNPDGFVDAWVAAGHDESSGVTAQRRRQPVRMDFIFVHHSISEGIRSVEIDSEAMGSDHKPVSMQIDF